MSVIAISKPIANFTLSATDEKTISLKDFKGKNVVLYFYPRDNTPGCTKESRTFEKHLSEFKKLNTVILGVSRDSVKSHENFRKKQGLSFDLLADMEEDLCNLFDVMKEKNLFGIKVRGIERSTFLIDANGVLIKEWRKVKVGGHVEEVLREARALS